MRSLMRQCSWVKCSCLGGSVLTAATLIIYLLLQSTLKKGGNVSVTWFSSQMAQPSTNDFPSRDIYQEYETRLNRVREVCDRYSISYYRILGKPSSNRINQRQRHCSTRHCPVIVNDDLLLYFCFIPKVASTTIKEFLLNVSGMHHRHTPDSNSTAFHVEANERLKRISPALYPNYKLRRYYKVLFVRHPFDRLVSTFRDKAEKPREEVAYFYSEYWDKAMKKYRQTEKLKPDSKPTFSEFIQYLIDTSPSNYDDHWAPYWSRCEPCLIQYDLIGKLETSAEDFRQVSRQMDVPYTPSPTSKVDLKREMARKYFSQITEQQLSRVYSNYKLDFEIFGYTLEEFFGTSEYKALLKTTPDTAKLSEGGK